MGAVSGSVHHLGGIFSVVFGIISVPAFFWSVKQALLSFCGLEQARKSASLFAFGRRKSGLIGLSHVRSNRRPVLEVGFSPGVGSAWTGVAVGEAWAAKVGAGGARPGRRGVLPGDRSGAIRIRIHGTQAIFRGVVICCVFGRRGLSGGLGAGGDGEGRGCNRAGDRAGHGVCV